MRTLNQQTVMSYFSKSRMFNNHQRLAPSCLDPGKSKKSQVFKTLSNLNFGSIRRSNMKAMRLSSNFSPIFSGLELFIESRAQTQNA